MLDLCTMICSLIQIKSMIACIHQCIVYIHIGYKAQYRQIAIVSAPKQNVEPGIEMGNL